MMASHAIKSVYQVFSDAGVDNDESAFVPAVLGYYSDSKTGHLLSQPFNSSTPVLYYNKDAFKRSVLDPEQLPQTCSSWRRTRLSYAKPVWPAAMPTAATKAGSILKTSAPGMAYRL